MFEKFSVSRISGMSNQERRWLNNIKKAIYESDVVYTNDTIEQVGIASLCAAIDVASLLHRSLNGESDLLERKTKQRFVEFVHLEVPVPEDGGLRVALIDARGGEQVVYSFGGLIYAIRCMTAHEYDNLNAAENPDYHIQLDWRMHPDDTCGAVLRDGSILLNARFVWRRLREVLCKFVKGIEAYVAMEEGRGFDMRAPLLSVRADTAVAD